MSVDFSVSTVLAEVWKAVGAELVIFVVTLVFAFGIRSLSSVPAAARKGSDPSLKVRSNKDCSGSGAVGRIGRPTATPQNKPSTVPLGSRLAAARKGTQRPMEVFVEIIECTKEPCSLRLAARALQLYQDELLPVLKQGTTNIKSIAAGSRHNPLELYSTLVNCATRVSKHHLVEGFVEDMVDQGVHRTLAFYESSMRQLASQKQYHLALFLYDQLAKDGLRPSAVTYSCLISFAAEVGELKRAFEFFQMLSATTTPSIRACMTILRVLAKSQDYKASIDIFRDMERRGVTMDSLVLNVVLATCAAADQVLAMEQLIAEAEAKNPPITDVVSYNTLLKSCSQRGDAVRAKAVLQNMKARGLKPSSITFNTAMDAMVRGGRIADSWALFDDMRAAGMHADKFTCSILVKGIAKDPSPRWVQAALNLLSEAQGACDASLKSTLFNIVLEAASKASVGADRSLLTAVYAQMRHFDVASSPGTQRIVLQSLADTCKDVVEAH